MIPIEQEPDRVPGGLLRVSAVAIAVMIAASVGAALLLARGYLGEGIRAPASPPPARLDTRLFRVETEAELSWRRADERLRRYGWVDRERGIVHVPLDVAIDLYLQERAP